jgi:Xaa-Pro aminopeptidase
VEAGTNDFGSWLRFEPLTLCPFDTSALIVDMLTPAEQQWLNDYHSMVYARLRPYLNDAVGEWLRKRCASI